MGVARQRPRGRPRKNQTRFAAWIDSQKLTRDELASRLGVARSYLDKLCRADSRPSLELAFEIEKLTKGEILASEWLRVPPHTGH